MGEDLADIVTTSAEDGEDYVADAALQRASGQASVGLHVPDLRLEGTSSREALCQQPRHTFFTDAPAPAGQG